MVDTMREPVEISDFTETFRGYPLLPSLDIVNFDEDDKYDIRLKPKNKQAHFQLQDIGNICICLGRVTSEPLNDYYLVQVLDGYPYRTVLVHKDDLTMPGKEL